MGKPKIGLALGAGAARGLAHIGVIDVLEKNNIKIDYIAGTSIGSVVGAYMAVHGEVKTLEQKLRKMSKRDFLKLVDFAAPTHAIIKGKKVKMFFDEIFLNMDFSQTKIPLRVVATNLYTGTPVIFSKGKIADAVHASVSIPGIFEPVKIENTLLVDGGIVNSTPIDISKEMGADVVIGVDLPLIEPDKIKKPSIIDTLIAAYEIMRKNTTKNGKNVIIIRPNVSGMNGYKFYNNGFIEKGRRAAKKELDKIKKMIRSFR